MSGNDTPVTRALRTAMVRDLIAEGAVPDPRWRAALDAIPRHVFVPEVPGVDDPAQALRIVYADRTVIIQRVDGVPTSSGTMPSLVAAMLHALDVRDGDRVLQVATGTGYTAALLCHRLGSSQVTTVDIDPALTATARVRLAACGLHPVVRTLDGVRADVGTGPYDRLVATVGLDAVPRRWLHDVVAGGMIVAPVRTGVLRLTVTGPGIGHGRFVEAGYFVPDRRAPARARVSTADGPRRAPRVTDLSARTYFDADFRFLLDLAAPGLVATFSGPALDPLVLTAADGSHARVDPDGAVTETGPREVWDEVERAHRRWVGYGRPSRADYTLTIGPDGQYVRLTSEPGEWRIDT